MAEWLAKKPVHFIYIYFINRIVKNCFCCLCLDVDLDRLQAPPVLIPDSNVRKVHTNFQTCHHSTLVTHKIPNASFKVFAVDEASFCSGMPSCVTEYLHVVASYSRITDTL